MKNVTRYGYVLWGEKKKSNYIWGRMADPIDQVLVELSKTKLLKTFDVDTWLEALDSFVETFGEEKKGKIAQIEALEKVMENLVINLQSLSNPHLIKSVELKYEAARDEYERLTADVAKGDAETTLLEQVYTLRDSYMPALENWDGMTRDEKRFVLRMFIKEIIVIPIGVAELDLTIRWRDGSEDSLNHLTPVERSQFWSASEVDELLFLLDRGESQVEIAKMFPDRKWAKIQSKASHLCGVGILSRLDPNPSTMRKVIMISYKGWVMIHSRPMSLLTAVHGAFAPFCDNQRVMPLCFRQCTHAVGKCQRFYKIGKLENPFQTRHPIPFDNLPIGELRKQHCHFRLGDGGGISAAGNTFHLHKRFHQPSPFAGRTIIAIV